MTNNTIDFCIDKLLGDSSTLFWICCIIFTH